MSHVVFEVMNKHTVIIDHGSGVLVQPMTNEYSYILTAKHNVLNNYTNDQSGIKNLSQVEITTFSDDKLVALNIYVHSELDIAVIKIAFRQGIEIYPYQKSPNADDSVMLYGYPEVERSTSQPASDQIQSYRLIIHEPLKEKISFRNSDIAPYEDIKGFSGGGLFHVDQNLDKAFLVGIENAMDSTRALHERVKGVPIAEFFGLLAVNKLAPLKPIYLSNFKHLNKSIFNLNDCVNQDHICHVKNFLSQICESNTKETNITPCDMLNKFKQYLKVYHRCDSELEEEQLWIAILELLVLADLLDSPEEWNESYIRTLFQSFRFIFIHSNNGWKQHLQEILSTSTEGLNPDGKILLIIGGALPKDSPIIPKKIINQSLKDITKGVTQETIANVRLKISGDTSIIHWGKLHDECILDREFDYKDFNLVEHQENIRQMLSDDYRRYLKPIE